MLVLIKLTCIYCPRPSGFCSDTHCSVTLNHCVSNATHSRTKLSLCKHVCVSDCTPQGLYHRTARFSRLEQTNCVYLLVLAVCAQLLLLVEVLYCRLLSLTAICSRAALWTSNWLEISSTWRRHGQDEPDVRIYSRHVSAAVCEMCVCRSEKKVLQQSTK